jgi:hypothetical protein
MRACRPGHFTGDVSGWPPEEPELERFRYDPATGLAQGGPWEPPHPPSRLESKAIIAGVHPDVVRDWLRAEVRAKGVQTHG